MTEFHKALRSNLGPDYLISHAPISPWFQGSAYPDGAYETVFKNVGDELDFFNLQYYNAEGNYLDCEVSLEAGIELTTVPRCGFWIDLSRHRGQATQRDGHSLGEARHRQADSVGRSRDGLH